MIDLIAALGLAFVLEGAIYALFPEQMKRAIKAVLETEPEFIRMAGLAVATTGILIVWLVRG